MVVYFTSPSAVHHQYTWTDRRWKYHQENEHRWYGRGSNIRL